MQLPIGQFLVNTGAPAAWREVESVGALADGCDTSNISDNNMVVSINGRSPKWMVSNRKSNFQRWFRGIPIFGKLHICMLLDMVTYIHCGSARARASSTELVSLGCARARTQSCSTPCLRPFYLVGLNTFFSMCSCKVCILPKTCDLQFVTRSRLTKRCKRSFWRYFTFEYEYKS